MRHATKLKAQMHEIFLAWDDTRSFVHDARVKVTNGTSEFDFGTLGKVVEYVGEHFGTFQDACASELLAAPQSRGWGDDLPRDSGDG